MEVDLIVLRAIANDPDVFPNPDKFDPQRWFTVEGNLRDDLQFCTYGFGRRYGHVDLPAYMPFLTLVDTEFALECRSQIGRSSSIPRSFYGHSVCQKTPEHPSIRLLSQIL